MSCSLDPYMKFLLSRHHAILSGMESFALATLWKRWMNLVGVLRPSFLAQLATGESNSISDGRLAYPSGHSAYIFCAMTVLSLYLLGKTRIFSEPRRGQFGIFLICLCPMVLATFVALTRIYDFEHAPADVNAGCFIGIVSGLFSYLLNYPSILTASCHLPRARNWSTQGLNTIAPTPKGGSTSELRVRVDEEQPSAVFKANSVPYPL